MKKLIILIGVLMTTSAIAQEISSTIKIVNEVSYKTMPKSGINIPISVSVDDYLEKNYSLERGFVCQSERDIKCVNGICDDKDYYWAIILNGDEQNTSLNSQIQSGDVLELVYRNRADLKHESLRKYLSSLVGK